MGAVDDNGLKRKLEAGAKASSVSLISTVAPGDDDDELHGDGHSVKERRQNVAGWLGRWLRASGGGRVQHLWKSCLAASRAELRRALDPGLRVLMS